MNDQYLLSITIITLLGLFIWSKFRYDALAAGALVVLVIMGVIPANQAFDGFAHPAVITVALVLIISQGLKNSGLTGLVGKLIGGRSFTKFQFLICLLFIAAILSSISLSTHSPALMDWVTRFASSSFWILTAFPSTLLSSA